MSTDVGVVAEDFAEDELSPKFLDWLIDRVVEFTNFLAGHDLHPYQLPFARRIIRSVIVGDGDVITALASRQSGKTEAVANVTASLMVLLPRLAKLYPELLGKFSDGFLVGMFAPVETQAETLFSRTVSRLTSPRSTEILGDPEIDDETGRTPTKTRGIRLKNSGSEMLMMTANPRAKIESKTFHLVVIDECFPAETPILTSEGWVPIGEIVNGDRRDWIVATQEADRLGWAHVRTGYRTPRHSPLVRVDHEHGSIYTTANHPFMVDGKAVPAISLTPGSCLSVVPGADQPRPLGARPQGREAVLLQSMSDSVAQPDGGRGHTSVDVLDPAEDWTPPQGAGREWSRSDRAAAETLGRLAGGLGRRACLLHWREDQGRSPYSLQDRPGEPESVDRGGDRREHSLLAEGSGSAEGPMAVRSRVVGVEVLQSGSPEFDQFSDRADYVYTLEVDSDSHTYVAGGALVGNCQEADDFVITKCYAEDTLLWLPDGSQRTVKDVVDQRLPVLSYDKPWDLLRRGGGRSTVNRANPVDNTIGALVPTTPVDWLDNGVQDVYRVSLASGRSVEVTAKHRWVVRERRGNSRPHWSLTQDLTPGMNVPLPSGVDFWGTRLTEDDGYFLGQMLGDGCLSASSPIWCGMDDPALQRMESYAAGYGTTMKTHNVQESGLHEVAFTKPGNGKNPLMAFLEQEGLRGMKGNQKRLVHDDYSREFYLGWVAGLFDSDGCISGKSAVFSNISEPLVRQLSDVLLKLGVPNRVASRKNNGRFGNAPKNLWEVFIRSREGVLRFAELIALQVPGKAAALRNAVDFHSDRTGRTSRYFEGVHWDRITEITYAGKKQTYCVTVEPSNLLIANGVVCGNSISPMLAYSSGTMVLTGTPTRTKGYFYKTIQLNKRMSTSTRGKANHYEWNWKEVAKVNANYGRYIRKEMLRIGEDSDEFMMSYNCRWMLDRGMFITETIFEELGDRSMQTVKAWHASPVIAGIDPARKQDSTVVTVMWVDWDHPDEYGFLDCRVLNWLEIQGDDWESQYYQIVEFLSHYDVLAVGVDANGVGDAVAQRLRLLLPRAEVVPVTSSQSEQSKRYKHLQTLIQRGMVGWPAHAKTRRLKTYQRFTQQMLDAEKKYTNQFFTVAAPDETGAHDDYVDSLAICASLTADMVMPTVQESVSPFF